MKIQRFSDVVRYLNTIKDINNGGCGISALAMYRWLKLRGVNDISFVFLYKIKDYDAYEENLCYLRSGIGRPTSASHVCLKYGNRLVDSRGVITGRNYIIHQNINDVDFIVMSIMNHGKWNYLFSWSEIINIERELNIKLFE